MQMVFLVSWERFTNTVFHIVVLKAQRGIIFA